MNDSEKIEKLKETFAHEMEVYKRLKEFYKQKGQSAIVPHDLMDEWLICNVESENFETLLDMLIDE